MEIFLNGGSALLDFPTDDLPFWPPKPFRFETAWSSVPHHLFFLMLGGALPAALRSKKLSVRRLVL